MVAFSKGNKDIVLRHLGLAYGFIYIEGAQPFLMIDAHAGLEALDTAVAHGMISKREADKTGDHILQTNIAKDGTELRWKLQQRFLPRNMRSRTLLNFDACRGCGMHGKLLDSWGVPVTTEVLSLMGGIGACQSLALKSGLKPDRLKLDSMLYAVKQMADSPRLPYSSEIRPTHGVREYDSMDMDLGDMYDDLYDSQQLLDFEEAGLTYGQFRGLGSPDDFGMSPMGQALARAMRRSDR